jgi:TfoX/Sxy family transcriptional regulator of competence genes
LRSTLAPLLPEGARLDEKNMFGGVAFMVDRHMCVGVIEDRVVARIGPEAFAEAMEQPDIGPMDFTGRPMKGWVYLQAPLVADPPRLERWVRAAISFVRSLPAKADKPRKTPRKARTR